MKSHQDNEKDYDELPWQAHLNCDCDDLLVDQKMFHLWKYRGEQVDF